MLNVTDLRNGTFFKEGNQVFKVLEYKHIKLGRGTANIKVKAKNILTGANLEKTFISGAKVEEADIAKQKVQFLYKDKDLFYFMDQKSFEQFSLGADILAESIKFLKEGVEGDLVTFEGNPLSFELPKIIELKVKETGAGVKGDTASSVSKPATLETGLVIPVPLFIKGDDTIRVDTRNATYIERVEKKEKD